MVFPSDIYGRVINAPLSLPTTHPSRAKIERAIRQAVCSCGVLDLRRPLRQSPMAGGATTLRRPPSLGLSRGKVTRPHSEPASMDGRKAPPRTCTPKPCADGVSWMTQDVHLLPVIFGSLLQPVCHSPGSGGCGHDRCASAPARPLLRTANCLHGLGARSHYPGRNSKCRGAAVGRREEMRPLAVSFSIRRRLWCRPWVRSTSTRLTGNPADASARLLPI